MLRELWREPRILGLLGLILLFVSMVLRRGYPVVAETVWWMALAMMLTGPVVMLMRKRRDGL
jgi:hypothetical protein